MIAEMMRKCEQGELSTEGEIDVIVPDNVFPPSPSNVVHINTTDTHTEMTTTDLLVKLMSLNHNTIS